MFNYKAIARNGKPIKTNVTLHPGEVLSDELEARSISKKDFASSLGIHASHFSDLIKGKRHISAKLAVKLEEKLGIDAEFWMRVQASYDLNIARKELLKA